MTISNSTPVLAVDEKNLIPVSDHLQRLAEIPPSRMFLINKSLKTYLEKNAGEKIFDASQGDGGASLPGTPKPILERALQLQLEHGTAYDMPFGTELYRKAVIEQYWKLDATSGWGPANVLGTTGGRDALNKAYQAMLALGHGRQGDLIMVSRVPWISYIGVLMVWAQMFYGAGRSRARLGIFEDAIREKASNLPNQRTKDRGLSITNPDNPPVRLFQWRNKFRSPKLP
ncbi:MAG: hypothetical protein LC108_08585 [Anaerolineales bacterium]|nr:hypothetical protein [Anaerolineales bacterium]